MERRENQLKTGHIRKKFNLTIHRSAIEQDLRSQIEILAQQGPSNDLRLVTKKQTNKS